MKYLVSLLCIAAFSSSVAAQPTVAEEWWSYLASYEAGPGSVRVNLGLRKVAPVAEFPSLVVTGPTYASALREGLPEAKDVNRMNQLQEQVVAEIAQRTPCIYAGTFTHNFEQLHYVYVKSTAGLAEALAALYAKQCPGCKTYTNVKQDAKWSAYTDFLFPNEATLEYYGLRLK